MSNFILPLINGSDLGRSLEKNKVGQKIKNNMYVLGFSYSTNKAIYEVRFSRIFLQAVISDQWILFYFKKEKKIIGTAHYYEFRLKIQK